MKQSRGEKIFNVCNYIILTVLCLICLYPLWHVLCASVSDPILLNAHIGGFLLPDGFTLGGYKRVFENPNITSGLLNSIYYVVVTTVLSTFVTSMAAYTLAHPEPRLNKLFMGLFVVTMYFGGGLVPFYLLTRSLGLMNTRWSVILPALVSTWNLIVLRTNFQGIPASLEESARLDGANDFIIYWKIIMPLSGAVVAYIVLLNAVGMWNAWFNASIFITDSTKMPLQVVLRDILIKNDLNKMIQGAGASVQTQQMDRVLLKYSTTIVAVLPIVIVYPFLQKYFVNGVMVGSVKG